MSGARHYVVSAHRLPGMTTTSDHDRARPSANGPDGDDAAQCGIFGHEPGPDGCQACGDPSQRTRPDRNTAHAVVDDGDDWCACGKLADDGIHVRP